MQQALAQASVDGLRILGGDAGGHSLPRRRCHLATTASSTHSTAGGSLPCHCSSSPLEELLLKRVRNEFAWTARSVSSRSPGSQ